MPKLGLVLSGGAIRGVAHIGMLKALEEHNLLDAIQVVIGTSAGSIVGAMFALGYSPDDIWEVWREDVWKMFGGRVDPDAIKDWNLDDVLDSLVHFDYTRFRGALKGDKLLHALERYLVREPEGTSVRPTRAGLPMYVVATDFNTGQETVWRFTRHIAAEEVPGAAPLEPGLGRRVHWEVHHDDNPDIEEFPTLAQACRCSSSIPFIFEPARALIKYKGQPRKDSLYTDGAVRDNYSLSSAVKLAKCDQVVGMFLGSVDVVDRAWNGLFDLANRTLDQMGMTIFEADQDDVLLRQTDIRTLVPRFSGSIGAFDVEAMGAIYQAGRSVTQNFLQAVRKKAGELSWQAVFSITVLDTAPGGGDLVSAQPRAAAQHEPGVGPLPAAPEVRYYIYRQPVE